MLPEHTLQQNVFTTAQVRELDRIAIEEHGIPGLELMKRAGQATFDEILQRWPEAKNMLVICGTGNNAGDGYIIARLALQQGMHVSILQLGDSRKIQGDALLARNEFLRSGMQILPFSGELPSCDIIVDAIFGTGLTRAAEGLWKQAIQKMNQSLAPIIAVDIPSGLNADTGTALSTTTDTDSTIKADTTVTFIGLKQGLLTGQGTHYVGDLVFDDLEVPASVIRQVATSVAVIPDSLLTTCLPSRKRHAHKGDYGHALLIGGSPGFSGAIRMSAEAAARAGAGLVSLATHPDHAAWANLARPELMVHSVETAQQLSPLLEKSTVIAIGPGLGQATWGRNLLSVCLNHDKPKVIDADALNLLAKAPCRRDDWVLTPHPGEAARLLGVSTCDVESNRYQAVRELQTRYGGICILKGAGTLIADKNTIYICTAGNPGMASGGMGDVLTGIIAALIAQQRPLHEAALAGVYLHATAADLAATDGERGLLASDLYPHIRRLANP
jgi:NAD(P)H-hydrate epimerase